MPDRNMVNYYCGNHHNPILYILLMFFMILQQPI